jgi:hypothetical protein
MLSSDLKCGRLGVAGDKTPMSTARVVSIEHLLEDAQAYNTEMELHTSVLELKFV